MGERLPNRHAFTVDRHANEPVTSPSEICHSRMLELSVTIWTYHQQIVWVMADFWIEMVYLKVWFAISFFERERAELTLTIVHFSKQNADTGGYTLVALGRTQKCARAWLAG